MEHCKSPRLQAEALGKIEYIIFNILCKTPRGFAHKDLSCLGTFFFAVHVWKDDYHPNLFSVSS